ncbi:flavoprotein [Jiangella sp. DSM 45060]|uniref:flavoprotein n=1 Tax=Jiangella sp. DSM 45060 TaxID=1798224 RepID=UPI00087C2E42|nr:flavoprotein [Jiangella sp. DSM 45060]SDS10373.1 Flavoprotein [Jiangella sp. DSM 45060]
MDWLNRRILLGIGGSVAAATMSQTAAALRLGAGARLRVVTTPAAELFATPLPLAAAAGHPVYSDGRTGDLIVPHVELAAWADLVLVMPATADLLAEAALGLAPNLLTTVLLAATCPVVMVPAMNAAMWAKPAVRRNVATLRADGVGVLDPVDGVSLGDGSVGPGALPALPQVLAFAAEACRVAG